MLTGVEDAMLVAHSHESLVDCGLHKFRVNFKERDGAKLASRLPSQCTKRGMSSGRLGGFDLLSSGSREGPASHP